MDSLMTPRAPISSSTTSHTPVSPSTPRTPLSLIPISSSPAVTPSPPPPRASKSTNNQQIAYSTEMLKFMDKVIHTYQLLLIEFRRYHTLPMLLSMENGKKMGTTHTHTPLTWIGSKSDLRSMEEGIIETKIYFQCLIDMNEFVFASLDLVFTIYGNHVEL
ncbi:hypothetical protein QL285_076580 [Trifolium repens]|nr:hypothetical protein QL285_076580 [Trifolium repens]